MKSLLLALAIIATAAMNNVQASQAQNSPSVRENSPQDGLTAQDQSNKPADVEVTKQIRRELMKDDSLSMKAKNVKIIVLNNGVTLKGPVESNNEVERILKHAYVSAPKHKIYNQISVTK